MKFPLSPQLLVGRDLAGLRVLRHLTALAEQIKLFEKLRGIVNLEKCAVFLYECLRQLQNGLYLVTAESALCQLGKSRKICNELSDPLRVMIEAGGNLRLRYSFQI